MLSYIYLHYNIEELVTDYFTDLKIILEIVVVGGTVRPAHMYSMHIVLNKRHRRLLQKCTVKIYQFVPPCKRTNAVRMHEAFRRDLPSLSCGAQLSSRFLPGSNSIESFYSKSKSRSFFKMLLVVTMVIAAFCSTAKATPLPNIPAYQDVEAALESSKCSVREEIVDIRKIHPTLPPDAKFMPSCVLLRKCTGCCQSGRHVCMPTSIYTTRIEISQQLLSPKRFNYITLNFTHHADCACQSPINPTCIPRVCSETEVWNKDLCQCEARCAPQECGHRQQWNPDTCRCQCRQCHPDHLVHSRFVQDDVTCICACRHALRNRALCTKRRVRFNTNRCTCVSPSRSFGHRGYSG